MKLKVLLVLMIFYFTISAQNNYFQQNVDYTINVKLDDKNHFLQGDIQINYTNNSTSTLDTLWFHLWPNAYKNNTTALAKQFIKRGTSKFYFSKDDDKGYIDSLNFSSGSTELVWNLKKDAIDICYVIPHNPIKPGATYSLKTPFRVKVPAAGFSRLGHSNQEYQITQWFPKPAVFDKEGWHAIPYLDKGEFYSEFGKFDVFITVPDNYVVAATGNLMDNSKEINWMKSRNYSKVSKLNNSIVSSQNFKTLHFQQDKIHDFAWFAGKYFIVDIDSLILPSGKKVNTWAFYHMNCLKAMEKCNESTKKTISFLSEKVGEYPYDNVSVVESNLTAGGGMEYPMITVVQKPYNAEAMNQVVSHEVIHNWFYGILGFNERKYPYLDEGFTTFYEDWLDLKENGNSGTSILGLNGLDFGKKFFVPKHIEMLYPYMFLQSRGLDQKINAESDMHSTTNYFTTVYFKAALSYLYLKNYLGETEFDKCMQSFYDDWKFRHPQPEDLSKSFEKCSSKDLSWYFDDILSSKKNVDYSLSKFKILSDKTSLVIKNKGNIQSPVNLDFVNSSGMAAQSLWIEGFKGKKTIDFEKIDDLKSIRINSQNVSLDINESNNSANHSGCKTLKFKPFYHVPKAGNNYIFYSPAIGVNQNDGLMLGIYLYNDFAIERKFNFNLSPMYAFNSNDLTGFASAFINFKNVSESIRKISVGITSRKYNFSAYTQKHLLDYTKIAPEMNIYFRSKGDNSQIIKQFNITYNYISKENLNYNTIDSLYFTKLNNYSVVTSEFRYANNRGVNPYSFNIAGQYHQDFIKFNLEAKYKVNYASKRSGLDIRFFAGKLFNTNENSQIDYRFRMANNDGTDDYLFNATHLGRGNDSGMFSRSMTTYEGGFAVPTIVGTNSNWLMALNLKSSIYKVNFIKLYLNAGTYYNAKNAFTGSKALMYEAGFMISPLNDVLEIYFPITFSSDIKQVLELNNMDNFGQRIRFVLNLEYANALKQLRDINL